MGFDVFVDSRTAAKCRKDEKCWASKAMSVIVQILLRREVLNVLRFIRSPMRVIVITFKISLIFFCFGMDK